MQTVKASFVIAILCTLATTIQAFLAIGGLIGLVIGLGPIVSWFVIFPFYLLEK